MNTPRLRIGVVGCGLIAQVMHLPYLAELDAHYEIAALCDLSESLTAKLGRRYGVSRTFTDADELLTEPLDAVLVATPGSHAPVAIAAAAAGIHVLVEKPMCITVAEGVAMIDAARAADVRLMVGTMKRYDPAYERLLEELRALDDLRLVQTTTLESPLEPFVSHLPMEAAGTVASTVLERLRAEDDVRVDEAVGLDADARIREGYRNTLLDCLVHELNALRGALGEPDSVDFAHLSPDRAGIVLDFGGVPCHMTWVDLPGVARYGQELAFYGPHQRATLAFASPFLRSTPTELVLEGGVPGTPRAWRSVETVSFDEAFKRELLEFHECVVTGRTPRTDGIDGLRDVALCTAIARSAAEGRPVAQPTAVPVAP